MNRLRLGLKPRTAAGSSFGNTRKRTANRRHYGVICTLSSLGAVLKTAITDDLQTYSVLACDVILIFCRHDDRHL